MDPMKRQMFLSRWWIGNTACKISAVLFRPRFVKLCAAYWSFSYHPRRHYTQIKTTPWIKLISLFCARQVNKNGKVLTKLPYIKTRISKLYRFLILACETYISQQWNYGLCVDCYLKIVSWRSVFISSRWNWLKDLHMGCHDFTSVREYHW